MSLNYLSGVLPHALNRSKAVTEPLHLYIMPTYDNKTRKQLVEILIRRDERIRLLESELHLYRQVAAKAGEGQDPQQVHEGALSGLC